MGRHVIGKVIEFPEGARELVSLEGRSIGVFNANGTFYALRNICPHQGAPICVGTVTGMTLPSKPGNYLYGREGEIVRCPWHGWEFDITNGKSIYDPHKCFVKSYEVAIEANEPSIETYPVKQEDGWVVLYI